jgi:hypothetical protein
MQSVPITSNVVSSNPDLGKVYSIQLFRCIIVRDRQIPVCSMVLKATVNNISAISWQSVLLVEETGVLSTR